MGEAVQMIVEYPYEDTFKPYHIYVDFANTTRTQRHSLVELVSDKDFKFNSTSEKGYGRALEEYAKRPIATEFEIPFSDLKDDVTVFKGKFAEMMDDTNKKGPFKKDDSVVIHGLKDKPALNGKKGTLEYWNSAKERWVVTLDEDPSKTKL